MYAQLFGIILLYAVLPMIVPSLAVYCSWLLTGLIVIGSFIMGKTTPAAFNTALSIARM